MNDIIESSRETAFRSAGDCPLLSIVIPTRNRLDSLKRLLRSIEKQDYQPREIIVLDDDSKPPIADLGRGITVIRQHSRLGACLSRNAGFDASAGDIFCSFDDDTELVDPTTLSKAVRLLNNIKYAGAVALRQLTSDGNPHQRQPYSQINQMCNVRTFAGYGFFLRRSVWATVGGFLDIPYAEEGEMSLRIRDAGWSVIYDPSLSLIHYEDHRGREREIKYLQSHTF